MSHAATRSRVPLGLFPDRPVPRLYDRVVEVLRVRHYSRRTEEAYVHWIGRFIDFCRQARLTNRVTGHTFRHSFATHLRADGYDFRTVQELLGHKDVRTTMISTHVLNRGGRGVRRPADRLTRGLDERQAGAAYHAENRVTMKQPTATI